MLRRTLGVRRAMTAVCKRSARRAMVPRLDWFAELEPRLLLSGVVEVQTFNDPTPAAPAIQAQASLAPASLRPGFEDSYLPRNDDGSSSAVPIGFTINFFGTEYDSVYVNNNGNITFAGPLSSYTPFGLLSASIPIIAPFFADVDTRPPVDEEGEELPTDNTPTAYGQGTVPSNNPQIGQYQAFGATWRNVGYYSRHDEHLNSFQVVLIDRSDIAVGDFDIEFNYTSITWEAGTASGGNANGLGGSTARAGFSNGTDSSFELPGSDVDGAFISGSYALVSNSQDSDALGRYRYKVRNGAVTGTIITVNSTRDLPDSDPEDSRAWTGEELPDDGPPEITLRAALQHANSTPNLRETIVFDIPENSPFEYANISGGIITFVPATPLPTITNPVVIAGNDIVRITGSGLQGNDINGLTLTSGSIELNGLIIDSFSGHGVSILGGGGNELYNLHVGTSASGAGAAPNDGHGIYLQDSSNNTIGQGDKGNVVSSNAGAGIYLTGGTANVIDANIVGLNQATSAKLPNSQGGIHLVNAPGNTISNNFVSGNAQFGIRIDDESSSGNLLFQNTIGTNLTGATGLGNAGHGLHILDAPNTNIGTGGPNVIAGNSGDGIRLEGDTLTGTTITNTAIGTNFNSAANIGNQGHGIYLKNVAGNTIGGASVNVISGNAGDGIRIEGTDAKNNTVTNSYIGTTADGTGPMGNGGRGVVIQNASNNTIGGATGNLISANGSDGVAIMGIRGDDLVNDAPNNTVVNNRIGTDVSATLRLGNAGSGIEAQGAPGLTVGGAGNLGNIVVANNASGIDVYASANALIAGNLVGTNAGDATNLGNGGSGISILSANGQTIINNIVGNNTFSGIGAAAGTGNLQITGNYVGVSPTGTAMPNQVFGIVVDAMANVQIGGPGDQANTVANNVQNGVVVHAGASGVRISQNSIYNNGGLGIDLGNDGVTANDTGDGDAGANLLQNYPVLTRKLDGTIEGELRSTPNSGFIIEFFANDAADPTGFGEGKSFVSTLNVTTDATGLARFAAPDAAFLTATATDAAGNTSEFSPALTDGIDLDPLKVVGNFVLDAEDGKFKADGVIQVGLKPFGDEEFVPIITVSGHMEYDQQVIIATGVITATIYDVQAPLFEGEWRIDVGTAITSALDEINQYAAGEFELAGVKLNFEGFKFVNPNGGSTHDGRIELRGKAQLPETFQNVELAITGENYIGISAVGVTFTGLNVTTENQYEFDINGFQLHASNLALQYDHATRTAKLGGTFELPQFNTTLDFDLALDRYFRIQPGPVVDFVGVITVDQPIPLFGDWSLTDLVIEMDTSVDGFNIHGTTTVHGFDAATFPTTLSITAARGVELTATSGEGEDFKLWEIRVDVDKIKLVSDRNPGDGEDFDPELSFAGNLRLPTQLIGDQGELLGAGDLEFMIPAENPLKINSEGVSLQQGTLSATGEWHYKLFNIAHIVVVNPTLEFNTQQQMARFRTTMKFPDLNNATFDFGGDNHYVEISRENGVQAHGDITIPDPINITSDGAWNITDVLMQIRTQEGKFTGSAKINGPDDARYDMTLSLTPTEGLTMTATTGEGTDFKVNALEFDVRKIEFVSDRTPTISASDWDPELRLAGKLTLPTDLTGASNLIHQVEGSGELAFEVPDSAPLLINSDGIQLQQGSISASGTWELNLFEAATVRITNPSIEFYNVDEEKWVKFQTTLTFPNLNDAQFNFSGDNYVKISDTGVQVVGQILFPGPFNITDDGTWAVRQVELTVDTVANKYTGTAIIDAEDREVTATAEITAEAFSMLATTTPPPVITLLGFEVTISSLGFTSDRDLTDGQQWDPQLEVQGKLKLPPSFGDAELNVTGANGLRIYSQGIELDGASLVLPGEHTFVALGLLEVQVVDGGFEISLAEKTAKLTGRYKIPSLNDFEIDLTGENHLSARKTEAGLEFAMKAEFTVDQIPIYESYALKNVHVDVNKPFEGAGSASGEATVVLPNGELGLGMSFENGRVTSVSLTTDAGTDFTLLSSEVDVRKLVFKPDINLNNEDRWEPQVEFQGSIKLPATMGGVILAIDDPNRLVVNETGFDLTGGKITFPDVEFNLLNLVQLKATDLSLEYIGGDVKVFKIQGKVNLPNLYDAEANFAGTNYIQIGADGVEVVGTLSAKDIVIIPQVWGVPEAELRIDTTINKVEAEATILIPTGIELIGGLGFIGSEFNFATLGVDELDVPIGATGAFLQKIQGQVDHVAEADPLDPQFGGSVGVTAGPRINISLPSWAGGSFAGAIADLDVTGTIDNKKLTAEGSLTMIGGLLTGTAEAELNWDRGYLKADGSLSALGGLINGTGSFRADSSFNVTMIGGATVTIPTAIPLIGGKQISGGNMMFQFRNDSTYANDFVRGWGTLNLPLVGPRVLGFQVNFDGSFKRIGAADLTPGGGTPGGFVRSDYVVRSDTGSASQSYAIGAGLEYILLGASWTEASDNVPVTLTLPDGTVLTEAQFAGRDDVAIVDDLSDATRKVVIVAAPAAGNYTLTVPNVAGLGQVTFDGMHAVDLPTLTLTAPAADVSGDSVDIGYTAGNISGQTNVSFYYDDDALGNDGILIDDVSISVSGDGSYTWDTRGVPAGTYHVYAVLDDGENPPVVTNYAPGSVQVEAFTLGSVTGNVFEDLDGNSQRDAGEPGLAGLTVYVDANASGSFDFNEPSAITDAQGDYVIHNVPAGVHLTKLINTTTGRQTLPANGAGRSIDIQTSGQSVTGQDFGVIVRGVITGSVYEDLNANGLRDAGEPGQADVIVYLDANTNSQLDAGETSMSTAGDGTYAFTGLDSGSHTVRQSGVIGYTPSQPASGGQQVTVSDGGQVLADINFGNTADEPKSDLSVSWSSLSLGQTMVPGDRGRAIVMVGNLGDAAINQSLQVRIVASVNDQLGDGDDMILADRTMRVRLPAMSDPQRVVERRLALPVSVPGDAMPGDLHIFVVVDPDNTAQEYVTANNAAMDAADPHTLAWQVGDVGGRTVRRLSLQQDGDKFNIILTGSGMAAFTPRGDGAFDLAITGGQSNTTVRVVGAGSMDLHDITVDGPMRQFVAPQVNLAGDLTVGSLTRLTLGDITGPSNVTIGGDDLRTQAVVSFGQVTQVVMQSQIALRSLVAASIEQSEMTVPAINRFTVTQGDLEAEIQLTTPPDPTRRAVKTLGNLRVSGNLVNSLINSAGRIGAITVGEMINSRVYAGVHQDVVNLLAMPTSANAFIQDTSIDRLTLTSNNGPTSPTFRNSLVAANGIGVVRFGVAYGNNNDEPFGFAASSITKINGDLFAGDTINLRRLSDPADSLMEDDFEIRIV